MAFSEADHTRKLNLLRHSFAQRLVLGLAYGFCVAFAIFFIDLVEKTRFIAAAQKELQQNKISQEVFGSVTAIINGAYILDSFLTILIVIGCLLAGRFILRRVAGLHWSRTITLSTAVEFSSAMRKMGKLDFEDQMACVYKHRLPVYIATTPLLEDQNEDIRAKLYPYAHNDILVLEDVLTKSIGKRLLCLDADDYDPVYLQHSQTDQAITLAKIAELERDNNALKGVLSLKNDENKVLTEENATLKADNIDLNKKLKMVKPRKGKDDKGDFRKIPLWRVIIPLGDRLKAEAQSGDGYTRTQIQSEFLLELEKFPDIKEAVQELLWPTAEESEDDKDQVVDDKTKRVPDWVINIIREDLQHLAKRTPGAPSQAKKDSGL